MKLYYHITKKTTNRKTGPITVLTSSHYTCSNTCPFKNNGCYGNSGPLNIHWRKVTLGERGISFSKMLRILEEDGNGQLIRLFQVGDLPGIGSYISFKNVKLLVNSLKNWKAFGYSHKPLLIKNNSEALKYCNNNNVCINLSGNNLSHADELFNTDIGPVVVTLPTNFTKLKTPMGRKVIICPAVKGGTTCSTCGGRKGPLCSIINRNFIIGFPAHGNKSKIVSLISK